MAGDENDKNFSCASTPFLLQLLSYTSHLSSAPQPHGAITDRADRDRFQPHRKFCWTEPKSEFMLEGPTFPKHVSSRSLNGIKALFTEKKWRWLLGWEPTTKEEQEGNPQSCGWGQNPECEHGVQEK